MRRDLINTLKAFSYLVLFIPFCLVGLIYRPLKWALYKAADFDSDAYYNSNLN